MLERNNSFIFHSLLLSQSSYISSLAGVKRKALKSPRYRKTFFSHVMVGWNKNGSCLDVNKVCLLDMYGYATTPVVFWIIWKRIAVYLFKQKLHLDRFIRG